MTDWDTRAKEAAKREAMKRQIPVIAEGLLWMAVHGCLCLGLRHPGWTGSSRRLVLGFVKELGKKLVSEGVLHQDELDYCERTEQEESPHGGLR